MKMPYIVARELQTMRMSVRPSVCLSVANIGTAFGTGRRWSGHAVVSHDVNTLCSEIKHPRTFSFVSPWIMGGFDLNTNCREYTQGKLDSDNVEIMYSLRPMT